MIIGKHEEVQCDVDVIDDDFEGSYQEFLEKLSAAYMTIPEENRGSVTVNLDTSSDWDIAHPRIRLYYKRLETTDEMLRRVAATAIRVNAQKRAIEEHERATLKYLLDKYGTEGEKE